jgi:hypothetical protein
MSPRELYEMMMVGMVMGICAAVPITIVGLVQFFKHKRLQLELGGELRLRELHNERLKLELQMRQAGLQPPDPQAAQAEAARIKEHA